MFKIIIAISSLLIAFFVGIMVAVQVSINNTSTSAAQIQPQNNQPIQPIATFTPTYRRQTPTPTVAIISQATPIPPTATPVPIPTNTATPNPQLQCNEQTKTISYNNLFRNIELHEGKSYLFRGQVLQVITSQQSWQNLSDYLVFISVDEFGYWYDEIYVTTDPLFKPHVRILEEDIITFCASVMGTYEYTTVLGSDVEVPDVLLTRVINILE